VVSSRSLFFEELESRLALSANPGGLLGPAFHDDPRSDFGPDRSPGTRHVRESNDAIRVVTVTPAYETADAALIPTLRLGEATPSTEVSRRTPSRSELAAREDPVTRTDRLAEARPVPGATRIDERSAVGWNPGNGFGFAGLLTLANLRLDPVSLPTDEAEAVVEAAPTEEAFAERGARVVVAEPARTAEPTEAEASDALFVAAVPAVPEDVASLAGPALSPEALAVTPLTRRLFEQLRQDMLRQMRQVLTEEQFKEFARALMQSPDGAAPAGDGEGPTPDPAVGK